MPCMLHGVFHASWVIPSSDRSFDFFLISNLAAPSEYYALHTSSSYFTKGLYTHIGAAIDIVVEKIMLILRFGSNRLPTQ